MGGNITFLHKGRLNEIKPHTQHKMEASMFSVRITHTFKVYVKYPYSEVHHMCLKTLHYGDQAIRIIIL
jgi:hypothetical protein